MLAFGEVLPKTEDHTWNDGAIIVMPTDTAEGVRMHICTTCGIIKHEAVPVISSAAAQSLAQADAQLDTYAVGRPETLDWLFTKVSE